MVDLSETEKISIMAQQIRSLLAMSQYASMQTMLQWIVSHPVLRQQQFSIAFYELTPEMTWECIKEAGPNQLSHISGFSDSQISRTSILADGLPWGYFFADSLLANSPKTSIPLLSVGLCLGTLDFEDGLLLCTANLSSHFKENLEVFSFIRVASEFIYRFHKMSQPLHEQSSRPAVAADVDHEERDTTLDGVTLTERQSQILELITNGLTNEEIAAKMHLSLGTIRVETSRLYDRLGARNRQQAASLAHLVLDH